MATEITLGQDGDSAKIWCGDRVFTVIRFDPVTSTGPVLAIKVGVVGEPNYALVELTNYVDESDDSHVYKALSVIIEPYKENGNEV